MKSWLVVFAIGIHRVAILDLIHGHGMLLSPPGRSSRWRYDKTAPINYDDNSYNCGGFAAQWYDNDGQCGLCGDNYKDSVPRANEMGGKYCNPVVIVQTYTNAYTANVGVQITANHLGYIYFELCNLNGFHVESEECFAKYHLKFADGRDKLYIENTLGWIESTIVLPAGLSCEHCVLRWTYKTGNNWGICKNGTGAIGCGPQENFKSCADIRIIAPEVISQLFPVSRSPTKSIENIMSKFPLELIIRKFSEHK